MKCNQKDCDNTAAFRFTWPGEDEAGICATCAPKLRGLTEAMGMHLQLIPLERRVLTRGDPGYDAFLAGATAHMDEDEDEDEESNDV